MRKDKKTMDKEREHVHTPRSLSGESASGSAAAETPAVRHADTACDAEALAPPAAPSNTTTIPNITLCNILKVLVKFEFVST